MRKWRTTRVRDIESTMDDSILSVPPETEAKLNRSQRALLHAVRLGYRVTASGVVLSPTGARVKCYWLVTRGSRYARFSVQLPEPDLKTGKRSTGVTVLAHRLAAFQKFGIAMLEPGIVVRHGPKGSTCNAKKNITIGTYRQNTFDRDPASILAGALHAASYRRKLTPESVQKIRRLAAVGLSHGVLARAFLIDKSCISRITRRKSYGNVK